MKKILTKVGVGLTVLTLAGAMSITAFATESNTTGTADTTCTDSCTSKLEKGMFKRGERAQLTDEQKAEFKAKRDEQKAAFDAMTDEEKAELRAAHQEKMEELKAMTPEEREAAIESMKEDGLMFGGFGRKMGGNRPMGNRSGERANCSTESTINS